MAPSLLVGLALLGSPFLRGLCLMISYKQAIDFSIDTPFQVLITNREVFFSNFIFYWGLCHPILSNAIYLVKKVATLELPKNLSKLGIIKTHCKYLNCLVASDGA
jgi:hypothetical protein